MKSTFKVIAKADNWLLVETTPGMGFMYNPGKKMVNAVMPVGSIMAQYNGALQEVKPAEEIRIPTSFVAACEQLRKDQQSQIPKLTK